MFHLNKFRQKQFKTDLPRRRLIKSGAAIAVSSVVAQAGASKVCNKHTRSQTQGPFYTTDTPLTKSFFAQDYPGCERIQVMGRVIDQHCEPIVSSLLDFWHADPDGVYDNQGYRFRGHQYSDEEGMFILNTCLPGLYPGRTKHIHVIVSHPDYQTLTTQLYFPDLPQNKRDGIFQNSLLMSGEGVTEDGSAQFLFDFILAG